jgi:16S rRNA (cytosine967-C5)-methyltransferase
MAPRREVRHRHATVTSARSLALDAMERIDAGAFSHIIVPQRLANSGLAPRDRALVTAFVYGAVRMQRVLDDALAPRSNRPLADLDPRVRAALRLGAFQLFDGVAPHAAVGETVAATPVRARPFVNAVLRALARAEPHWPSYDTNTPMNQVGARSSHPDWIVSLLLEQFGVPDTVELLRSDNTPPAVTLRANPQRNTVDALVDELHAQELDARVGELVPGALVLDHARDPNAIAAVREGRASPQDQASQAVVAALDPQPGDRVLDLAAAPGGKAAGAAERIGDDGVVIAADVHKGRVGMITGAARRLGLRSLLSVVADGAAPPFRPAQFDRVLLDAPCSGLGVLRRRPDARWRIKEADVAQLAVLQRELLGQASACVRPGGRLVYSVCTVSREETIEIDEWARGSLPQLRPVAPPSAPWRAHGRGALLLPHDAGTDGMYVLVFEVTR